MHENCDFHSDRCCTFANQHLRICKGLIYGWNANRNNEKLIPHLFRTHFFSIIVNKIEKGMLIPLKRAHTRMILHFFCILNRGASLIEFIIISKANPAMLKTLKNDPKSAHSLIWGHLSSITLVLSIFEQHCGWCLTICQRAVPFSPTL
jgi:hypothetical protein